MNFTTVLAFLEGIASAAATVPGAIGGGAGLADILLKIVQASVKAHEAVTKQPLDLTKLHDLPPLPPV